MSDAGSPGASQPMQPAESGPSSSGFADAQLAAAATCPINAHLPSDFEALFNGKDPWRSRRTDLLAEEPTRATWNLRRFSPS